MSENKRPVIMGTVETIMPEWVNQTGSFHKQEIVIDTGFRYPNPIKVTFKNDKMALLSGLNPGDKVVVGYGLDGRKWDGPNGTQYFVDIAGLDLERIGGGQEGGSTPGAGAEPTKAVGMTLETCVKVWEKHHGDDKPGFAAFCKQARPDIVKAAADAGQKFTTFAANRLDVWADIANRIEAAATQAAADEELPF